MMRSLSSRTERPGHIESEVHLLRHYRVTVIWSAFAATRFQKPQRLRIQSAAAPAIEGFIEGAVRIGSRESEQSH
jgi:hypothetical protein